MIPGPDFQLLIVTVISEASCGPPRRPTGRPFIDYRRNSGLFAEIATPCHTARLSFRVGLPGLIFDLWAVPPKTGRALGARQSSPGARVTSPAVSFLWDSGKPSHFPRGPLPQSHGTRSPRGASDEHRRGRAPASKERGPQSIRGSLAPSLSRARGRRSRLWGAHRGGDAGGWDR